MFRGRTKSKSNIGNHGVPDGLWVTGYLRIDCRFYLINAYDVDLEEWLEYEVDPETICQCTGAVDKSGELVFENDFVYLDGIPKDELGGYGYITYRNGGFMLVASDKILLLYSACTNNVLSGRISGTMFDAKNREK